MWKYFSGKQLRRLKYVWGTGNIWNPGEIRHWLQHPQVQRRINQKITAGFAEGFAGDRFQYFLQRYLAGRLPVDRALTLGSGGGELERGLAAYGFARHHQGFDISDHAVRAAQHAAASSGLNHLRYEVAELNTVRLEPSAYDVVFGISSIHHVEKLEHLFQQIHGSLKRDGYLMIDEYIGPSQFQWTDKQLHLMNELLLRLPEELRRSAAAPGSVKNEVTRKTLAYMNEADPSEAIRSADIMPLLSQYFQILEFKGYGGSLLHELLYDIAGNFSEKNSGSLECLEALFRIEDEQIEQGQLPHDFAVVIAAPR
jgi:SAM-dependent methyltransferase